MKNHNKDKFDVFFNIKINTISIKIYYIYLLQIL